MKSRDTIEIPHTADIAKKERDPQAQEGQREIN